VRFPIDAQLPPSLARQLSSYGHQATHVARFAEKFSEIVTALERGETIIELSAH
jgi:predicted nuclease of predicted toxin-antitoxin system